MVTSMRPNLADIQGNILRGYRKPHVLHLVLTIRETAPVGNWLLDATGRDLRVHQITTAEPWDDKPASCLNVAVTAPGLAALRIAPSIIATFPEEFVQGMAQRALKIGDIDESAPQCWKPEWRAPELVHLVVTVYANSEAECDEIGRYVLAVGDGRAFAALTQLRGSAFPDGKVHFGYRDSIAQPQFVGVHDAENKPDQQPLVEIGAVLLGYPTPVEDVIFDLPEPALLGVNGAFNAFRVLEQDVVAFEEFLSMSADTILKSPLADQILPPGIENTWEPPLSRHDAMRECVAAKVLGRWRNGVPLSLSPFSPTPRERIGEQQLNNFGFQSDDAGARCPMSSHIRRCNPRDARIVQRSTNHARRIVRRGVPYGPLYDPATAHSPHVDAGVERGLLGSFLCGSLAMQFESIQYDWMNLGLLDPRITGSNDVIVGANDPKFSVFSLPVNESSIELRGFSRFTTTRGGAYLFLPSLTALRHLGQSAV